MEGIVTYSIEGLLETVALFKAILEYNFVANGTSQDYARVINITDTTVTTQAPDEYSAYMLANHVSNAFNEIY